MFQRLRKTKATFDNDWIFYPSALWPNWILLLNTVYFPKPKLTDVKFIIWNIKDEVMSFWRVSILFQRFSSQRKTHLCLSSFHTNDSLISSLVCGLQSQLLCFFNLCLFNTRENSINRLIHANKELMTSLREWLH